MSHIVSFKIAGLAGREGIYSQKLNRDINVFFGLNGSGKTSLLRILDSAMSYDASRIKEVPFEYAEITIHSLKYNKNFTRTIRRDIFKNTLVKPNKRHLTRGSEIYELEDGTLHLKSYIEKEKRFHWITKTTEPKDAEDTRWRHIYLPTWRLYTGDEPYLPSFRREGPEVMRSEYDWEKIFAGKLVKLWSTYSNQLLSEIRNIHGRGIANILVKGVLSKSGEKAKKALDTKTVYKRVAAFLKRQGDEYAGALGAEREFCERLNDDPRLRRVVGYIDSIETRIEKTMSPRYKLEDLIRRMFSGNKTLTFKDTGIVVETKSGKEIDLACLSSGEKHAIFIFLESLLAEDCSLLIDEPEISLHIDWQKVLIPAMHQLNPSAQLILATHSPEITGSVSDDKVFRL